MKVHAPVEVAGLDVASALEMRKQSLQLDWVSKDEAWHRFGNVDLGLVTIVSDPAGEKLQLRYYMYGRDEFLVLARGPEIDLLREAANEIVAKGGPWTGPNLRQSRRRAMRGARAYPQRLRGGRVLLHQDGHIVDPEWRALGKDVRAMSFGAGHQMHLRLHAPPGNPDSLSELATLVCVFPDGRFAVHECGGRAMELAYAAGRWGWSFGEPEHEFRDTPLEVRYRGVSVPLVYNVTPGILCASVADDGHVFGFLTGPDDLVFVLVGSAGSRPIGRGTLRSWMGHDLASGSPALEFADLAGFIRCRPTLHARVRDHLAGVVESLGTPQTASSLLHALVLLHGDGLLLPRALKITEIFECVKHAGYSDTVPSLKASRRAVHRLAELTPLVRRRSNSIWSVDMHAFAAPSRLLLEEIGRRGHSFASARRTDSSKREPGYRPSRGRDASR